MFLASQFLKAANQDSLEFRLLTTKDLDGFLALQEKALAALSPARAHHLKPRGRADLMVHLDAGMAIPAIFLNGAPVGQLVLSDPRQGDAVRNLEGYPLDKTAAAAPAIVQAVNIAPEARGMGVAQTLLACAEIIAALRGHDRLIAKVAADNPRSLAAFNKAGFSVFSAGHDPAKGYPVQYLEKSSGKGPAPDARIAPQHALFWTPEPPKA